MNKLIIVDIDNLVKDVYKNPNNREMFEQILHDNTLPITEENIKKLTEYKDIK